MKLSVNIVDIDNLAFNKAMEEIWSRALKTEEELVISVLKQWLNREPTKEDFKYCQRIMYQGVHDRYILCYRNIALGSISREIYNKHYRVVFNPHQTNL